MGILDFFGETTKNEKKEILEINKPKSWLKTVSAFANTDGGKIIFGISDDGKAVGLKNYKYDSEKISELIRSRMDPIPNTNLDILEENGKFYIVLTVFAGEETPYYFIESGSYLAFTRIGNESVKVNSTQHKNLILRGKDKNYELQSSNIPFDQASFLTLKATFAKRTGKEFGEEDFKSCDLIDDKGYLTNAGALLADDALIYQSKLFCTRWNGLDKVNGIMEAFDDAEYSGGLLNLLFLGEQFIKTNSKKMWRKTDLGRVEYPEYPEIAVREALVNALIHRDYSEQGSEIHIDIYDDRLEIFSPGGMIDGTLIQDLNPKKISSRRRNPMVADIFSRMNLMERRGSGLRKILEIYELSENYTEKKRPEFESNATAFFITLKNLNYQITENIKEVAINDGKVAINDGKVAINDGKVAINDGKVAIKTLEQKQIILEYASRNMDFKVIDIEKLLKVKSSRARKIVSEMVKEGSLSAAGKNRSMCYRKK